VALIYRIKVEEEALRETMGDGYAVYADGRPRLLPGIW
jgi:protein-S-isoprenylcysteine O-methyltransferase Ste14